MDTILDKLQKEASKQGYQFNKAEFNEFSWIKADYCFYLSGYKPSYDIRDDFGNKYTHDKYKIVSDICTKALGKSIEIHTPNMDLTGDSYWGTSYERWQVGDIKILNYMYGHPRSGFFNTWLYIHKGKLDFRID
ncbi:hypothetical protein CSC2_06620 [Clostridium zeae]|uniref:Uncharacterized protein n=1 Tax=Clostridium zeae TaxID=2759022 RepID=A0ABQ1E5V8_9CLOT|nr:hypothetical protein [Clostridium zeae]GFZ30136.1 hypothetical protein CSC2_06620 [Clostridium zeae]